MSAAEHLNFVGLRNISRKSNATRAEDASFLIELDERTEVERFSATSLLSKRVPAVMASMGHVVILEPTLAGLIANGTIDWMVKEEEFHRVPDGLMDALGVGADFHIVGDRGGAGRYKLWCALYLDETHAATAFNADVGMVAVTRNFDADPIGNLDDGSSLFGLIHLAIDRDLRHKQLE